MSRDILEAEKHKEVGNSKEGVGTGRKRYWFQLTFYFCHFYMKDFLNPPTPRGIARGVGPGVALTL